MKKKTKTLLVSSAILGAVAVATAGGLVGCTSTIDNETFTANNNGISIKNDLVATPYYANGSAGNTITLSLDKPATLSLVGNVYKITFNINVSCMYVLNGAINISKPTQSINNLPNIYVHQHILPVIINNQTYIIFLTNK